MSMGSYAAELLAAESSQWSDAKGGINSLLKDRRRMAWMSEAAYHFARVLDGSVRKHRVFPTYGSPLFLIDFDVIFEYLSVKGNASPRSLAVEAFFSTPDLRFAVPLGSFLELLGWLNWRHFHVFRNGEGIDDPEARDYSTDEAIQVLAQRLSVKYSSSLDTQEALQAVRSNVDDDIIQIDRLIHLLTHSKGVWGTFLEDDLYDLLPYVRSITRYDERGGSDELRQRKERRDQRDAMNLAITCFGVRSRQHEGVLLLTSTTDFVQLPDHFGIGNRQFEPFQDLMNGLLALNDEPVAQYFPVVTPFDVWIWQLMRRHYSSHHRGSPLIETRDAFHRLKVSLDQAMDEHLEGLQLSEARDRARNALSSISNLKADEASPIGPFLEFSLSEIAVSEGRRLFAVLQRAEVRSGEDHEKYLMLARLLQQLGTLIATEHKRMLRWSSSPLPKAEGSSMSLGTRFNISLGHSDLRDQACEQQGLSVVNGEIYAAADDRRLYVIRWPVICRVATFITAARRILRNRNLVINIEGKDQLPTFVRAGAASPLWESGFIVYTSQGALGTDLRVLFQSDRWEALRERLLAGALRTETRSPNQQETIPEILAIRVNSPLSDFIYDIVPPDQESTQYITYISNAPVIEDLISLMNRTSSRFVRESDLTKMLHNVISDSRETKCAAQLL
jgi:hypothetical protein